MSSHKTQNLTEGNIFSSLIRLAFPLMGSSFLQMAYTLMAMGWVGRLGEDASRYEAAIGGVGMLLWFTSTLAMLAMIGGEISVGQSIGAKRMERARRFASHATTIAIIVGVVWSLVVLIFANVFMSYFKLDAKTTAEAATFLRILVIVMPFQFLAFNFAGIYNGAGRTSIPFRFNGIGLVLNMILDPFFMFTLDMGFLGAAIGSVIAQLCVFVMFYRHIKGKNSVIGSFPLLVKLHPLYLKRVLFLGTPVSLMAGSMAIINMTVTRIASTHGGHLGMLAQTTGAQLEGITWNTSNGFSTALSAFVAQNYAAKRVERGLKAYFYTLRIMLTLGVVVSACFMLYGKQIFGLIIPHEEAMQAGAEYLMIVGAIQVFMMLEITTQGMFNGLGRTIEPAVISISCNLLRIPLAIYLAGAMGGVIGVWWALAISTALKGIIMPTYFSILYRRIRRKQEIQGQHQRS